MKKDKGNMRIYYIFISEGEEEKMDHVITRLPRRCLMGVGTKLYIEYGMSYVTRYKLRIREHELMLIKLSVNVTFVSMYVDDVHSMWFLTPE